MNTQPKTRAENLPKTFVHKISDLGKRALLFLDEINDPEKYQAQRRQEMSPQERITDYARSSTGMTHEIRMFGHDKDDLFPNTPGSALTSLALARSQNSYPELNEAIDHIAVGVIGSDQSCQAVGLSVPMVDTGAADLLLLDGHGATARIELTPEYVANNQEQLCLIASAVEKHVSGKLYALEAATL